MMTLYHATLSPCAQKVRLVLAEKDVPWTSRVLDLMTKENLEPWYLEKAPKGLVPALEHDGQVVTESTIIAEYLEDRFPEVPLLPERALDRARARAWMKLVDEKIHPAAGPIVFGGIARPRWLGFSAEERERLLAKVPDPARRARQRAAIEKGLEADEVGPSLVTWSAALAELEKHLSGAPWLAGERYSLADAAVTPYVFYMERLGMSLVFERHPGVRAWYERVAARPSFARALVDVVPAAQWDAIAKIATETGPVLNERLRSFATSKAA